jgi:hypothetical protein
VTIELPVTCSVLHLCMVGDDNYCYLDMVEYAGVLTHLVGFSVGKSTNYWYIESVA